MEFILSANVRVSVNGDFEDHDLLVLKAPPAKEKKYPIKLRKGFMNASTDMIKFADPNAARNKSENDQAEEESKLPKPQEVEQMIYASDINVEKYIDDFRSLMMISGVCTIGGQKLTSNHWDQIAPHDVDRLIGEYLVNFYIPLWEGKKITTEL